MTEIIFISIVSIYIGAILLMILGWRLIKSESKITTNKNINISVLIPVRNEEQNISKLVSDLEMQDLNFKNFEVIIINDHSTDRTRAIVTEIIKKTPLDIKLYSLVKTNFKAPKKDALKLGVSKSKGEIIVTTDGDCRVKPTWLSLISSKFHNSEYELVFGPVLMNPKQDFKSNFQDIEMASLVGVGGVCLKLGAPNMCNGANLAFTKKIFNTVNGYIGNEEIASGDDEFLMHKIYQRNPGSVGFIKEREALVTTQPFDNWSNIYHQKKRWASKWSHYKLPATKIIGLLAFCLNFSWIVIYIGAITGLIFLEYSLTAIFLKLIIDYIFVSKILEFYNRKLRMIEFILISIAYPIYVFIFGLISRFGNYHWKGRKFISQPG